MSRVDEGLEVRVGAEVRVDLCEVRHPIAMIGGAFLTRRALDRLVLENRGQPDRGDAHVLDIVEPLDQPFQIAAVVVALVRRVETGFQPVALEAPKVVLLVTILEPVRKQEIDYLVLRQAGAVILSAGVSGQGGGERRARQDKLGHHRQLDSHAFHAIAGVAAQRAAMKSS